MVIEGLAIIQGFHSLFWSVDNLAIQIVSYHFPLREIEMLQCEGFFIKLMYDFEIPNGENVLTWFAHLVLKFRDDPTVN